ncbi:MAG: hypothetical protein ACKO0W_12350 [Planctomycetota bacterium]
MDRRNLAGLVDRLREGFAAGDRRFSSQMDLSSLRRFRRDLEDSADLLASRAPEAALDRLRSICSEALVLQRLLDAGCEVEREVQTPAGRRVDFRARRDCAVLHVHVKRAPRTTLADSRSAVPAWTLPLERVGRGFVAALRIERAPPVTVRRRLLAEAREFLEQASVGERLALRAPDGAVVGHLRIVGPSTAGRVVLVPDLSGSFDEDVPRFQATLRKAFTQFMPRAENLIVVCGAQVALDAFAVALLGSQIERWDRRPRAGELVAYGRGGDGFWSGAMRNQSRLAAYWPLVAGSGPLLFVREGAPQTRGAQLARAVFA